MKLLKLTYKKLTRNLSLQETSSLQKYLPALSSAMGQLKFTKYQVCTDTKKAKVLFECTSKRFSGVFK